MPSVSNEVPDEATRAAIRELAHRVEITDGAPPLSDDALTHLDSPAADHVALRTGTTLDGYAQRRGGSAEVVGEAAVLGDLLDAVTRPGLLVWSHGRRSRLAPVLSERGFARVRELHQLRRPLDDLPEDPALPDRVVVRPFEAGRDEQAWLAVNAAAFATHPEQGRQTLADLRGLMAQPWFRAADLLLAEGSLRPERVAARGVKILGFHWTKVHPDGAGEVYVLGIAPAAQGLGLGNALLIRGLRHLAARCCAEVLLYVDGDNAGALRLYERAGFRPHDLDLQWRAPE